MIVINVTVFMVRGGSKPVLPNDKFIGSHEPWERHNSYLVDDDFSENEASEELWREFGVDAELFSRCIKFAAQHGTATAEISAHMLGWTGAYSVQGFAVFKKVYSKEG